MQPLMPLLPLWAPVLVTFLAGLLQQDGLPKWANSAVVIALALAGAVIGTLYDHSLTSNLVANFGIICVAMVAIIDSSYMTQLRQYLQGNVLTLLHETAQLNVVPPSALAAKPPQPIVMPVVRQPVQPNTAPPMSAQFTAQMPVVGPAVQNNADWMNDQP